MPVLSIVLQLALHDVAPDCEEAEDDYARSLFARYANNHGFGGGASNKCLQNFVVRYNNYDEDAYESFVGELHGYLFQDVRRLLDLQEKIRNGAFLDITVL